MTTYVYKSTTGHPVNIDNFTITPNPGLQLKYPNDILDAYLGTSINRYDDGVLVSSDPEVPVMATKTLTGGIEKLIVDGVAIPGIGSHEKHSMRRLAIIGDSLTETTTGPYGSTNPVSQYRDNGFITWGLARAGVSARIVYNAGVGSSTAAGCLTRYLSGAIPDHDALIYMIGINDATTGRAFWDVVTDIEAVLDLSVTAGVPVIACAAPSKTGLSASASQLNLIRGVRKWLERKAQESAGMILFADIYGACMESNGDFKASYSYDGTHLTNFGAYHAGGALVASLQSLFGTLDFSWSPDDFVGTNNKSTQLCSVPCMLGTTGTLNAGVTGQLATGWTAYVSGPVTAVLSKVPSLGDAGEIQRAVITATGAGSLSFYPTASAESLFDVSKKAVMRAKLAWSNSSGAAFTPKAYIDKGGASAFQAEWCNLSTFGTVALPDAAVIAITPAVTVSSVAGYVRPSVRLTFSGAGSVTFDIQGVDLRAVPV